jgi:hypothetical protein
MAPIIGAGVPLPHVTAGTGERSTELAKRRRNTGVAPPAKTLGDRHPSSPGDVRRAAREPGGIAVVLVAAPYPSAPTPTNWSNPWLTPRHQPVRADPARDRRGDRCSGRPAPQLRTVRTRVPGHPFDVVVDTNPATDSTPAANRTSSPDTSGSRPQP